MGKVMQEAMDQEDYDRMDKGLPPKKRPKVEIPDPKSPAIKDMIVYADLSPEIKGKIVSIAASPKSYKNSEGVRFVGYEVGLSFSDKSNVKGWMGNKDFVLLRHDLFIEGKVDVTRILDI